MCCSTRGASMLPFLALTGAACIGFASSTHSLVRANMLAPRPQLAVMAAADGPSADLIAASQQGDSRRMAVSGLQPQGKASQQQQYVGVPPPGTTTPPTFFQKARAPFMGVTVAATMAVAAWQSQRLYKRRVSTLLDEFAATMIFHIGDEREMAAAYSTFKTQLGPGRFTGPMVTTFLVQFARDVPVGVKAIQQLKAAMAIFRVSDDAACATLLEAAATKLERQPSVLNKLVFAAERAIPQASAMAKLRTKFPNWSFDTVAALQRAMLEDLYRTLCEEQGLAAPDAETRAILGLSNAEAARLLAEVQQRREDEAAEKAAKIAEAERARQLQEALERAAAQNAANYKATGQPRKPVKSIFDTQDVPQAGPAPTVAGPAPTVATKAAPAVPIAATDFKLVTPPPPPPPPAPKAAPPPAMAPPSAGAGPTNVGDGDGQTHEYECTSCGYVLFPAAGREHKFFGDSFTCPQCGAGKDQFVDNGVVT